MSLFLATVPQGTQLYHGTSKAERINDTQWLAFEPEHALVFARSHKGPPPGRGGPPGPRNDEENNEEWHPPERYPEDGEDRHVGGASQQPKKDLKREPLRHEDLPPPLTHTVTQRYREQSSVEQQQEQQQEEQYLHDAHPQKGEDEEDAHGYLHTYLPNRDLKLLYIDGQSAAKSDKGTLDMQDIVLLQKTPPPQDGGGGGGPRKRGARNDRTRADSKPGGRKGNMGGPMSEGFRADHLCSLAKHEWEGRIDGFIRMEMGFEIILCDFERDLDVLRITQVKPSSEKGGPGGGGPGGPKGGFGQDESGFAYYQAVASRFDGIGGGRVRIDYENMVSLFADEKAIFFDKDDLPRVRNESKILEPIFDRITEMILRRDARHETTNWQATTDMLISRYSNRIAYLSSGTLQSLQALRKEIEHAMKPFIDYAARDKDLEIRRCATQFLTHRPHDSDLAAHAVLNVAGKICSSFSTASEAHSLSSGMEIMKELKNWLNWTEWKKCNPGCGVEEVCFIPIWPLGSLEERETPKCIAGMNETGRGYWGRLPGRPPPPDGKDFS